MPDELKTDFALDFMADGTIDVRLGTDTSAFVSGEENLAQALKLRLLLYRGALAHLGHPRFGTVIRDLIGEPMTRANLELLRRYVRKALKGDPRVAEVVSVIVQPRDELPGAVDVTAVVTAVSGSRVEIDMTLDEQP